MASSSATLSPTDEINGCIHKLPTGSMVILLDYGLLFSISPYCRWYLSYYTWHQSKPFCRDHPQEHFGMAIVHMAAYLASGNYYQMKEVKVFSCPSLPVFEPKSVELAFIIDRFILLHEYGHYVLGSPRER